MFSNTKIHVLLSWGFGIIITLVTIMAVVVYERSGNLGNQVVEATQDAYQKINAAETIKINVIRNWANTLLLIQLNNADDLKRVTEEMAKNSKEVTGRLDFLQKNSTSDQAKQQVATIFKARTDYADNRKQLLALIKSGNKTEANLFLASTLKANLETYVQASDALAEYQSAQMAIVSAQAVDLVISLKIIIAVLSIFVVLVAIGTALLVVRVIRNALGGEVFYANDIARQITAGNLGVEVLTESGDNTSLLASMKSMRDQLRHMVFDISESATKVGQSARDLVQASKSVSDSSNRQSGAASASAAAIEEMTVSINQIASNTKEAHSLAINSEAISRKGGAVIRDATSEMSKIASSVNASSGIISSLEKQSNEISAVVEVIKEIADQTNLLALNAAIEAARAGEDGRGFAVVADEVRKLADRTSLSTQEIAATIKKIQDGTRHAVKSMAAGAEQVKSGTALAQQAGSSIVEIESEAKHVVVVVNGIADSLKEQTAVSNEIARNIEDIASMIEANNAAAARAAGAAQQLEQLADKLSRSIGSFRL